MKTPCALIPFLLILQLSPSIGFSQDFKRLEGLETNYNLAVERAVKPLRSKYISELVQLKKQYKQSGDLEAANKAQAMIEAAQRESQEAAAAKLSGLSELQFKNWLKKVTIIETEGPFSIRYQFDGKVITSQSPNKDPRTHENAKIDKGEILVPFTSTNATIKIDNTLKKATITYSTGGEFKGEIVERK